MAKALERSSCRGSSSLNSTVSNYSSQKIAALGASMERSNYRCRRHRLERRGHGRSRNTPVKARHNPKIVGLFRSGEEGTKKDGIVGRQEEPMEKRRRQKRGNKRLPEILRHYARRWLTGGYLAPIPEEEGEREGGRCRRNLHGS